MIKVKASANPRTLASSLAFALHDGKTVTLRAIGAGAVNQAIKACAIARGIVATRGVDLSFRPGFATVDGKSGPVSAVVLFVECK